MAKNLPQVISDLKNGKGIFVGSPLFIRDDGSVVDVNEREQFPASALGKAAYDEFEGMSAPSEVGGAISAHNDDAGAHAELFAPINTQIASDAITHMLATEFSGAYEGVDLSVRFATEIAGYSDVWAWVKARVQAENFAGLHVHDYITVTCTNAGAYVLKMEIAGINTYKGSGGIEIPAHIDWISKDCWPDTVQYNLVNFNNGIGCDKFTATAGQTSFQLTYRGSAYPSSITSMTVNGGADTSFTYNSATGIMTYTGSALSAGAIVKAFWTAVDVPFMASNLNAYMNSLRVGVPNEAALDPFLTEVDYSAGGIYYYLPSELKAVITPKRMYAATRYTAGSLLSSSNNNSDVTIGPLWIPEGIEVCGSALFATGTYDKWYARQYPAFFGGNRKKGAGNGGSRVSWWVFSANSGNTAPFCYVFSYGYAYFNGASTAARVPVCFRIAKT